jgi:hypothetical protein
MTTGSLRRSVAACVFVAGSSLACGSAPSRDATHEGLPPTLHGLPLVTVHEGEAAAGMIGGLHGLDVAPVESRVAVYAVGDLEAVLYVSRFPDDSVAANQLSAMSDRIGEGSSGFERHVRHDVDGIEVHGVVGHGQVHYFFARGSDLIWLAAPPMMARMLLAEVLGVEPELIPADPPGGTSAATAPLS